MASLAQAERRLARDSDIVNRWRQGQAQKQIAEAHGLSCSRVQNIIAEDAAIERMAARKYSTDPRMRLMLRLLPQTRNILQRRGYQTPDVLEGMTDEQLLATPGLGPATLQDVRRVFPRRLG